MKDDRSPPPFRPDSVHLLRTTQLIHMQLSAMADHKANILMGATFITFTLAVGQLRSQLGSLPLLIMAGAAFLSAVLSILTVMPVGARRVDQPNLLFFEHFYRLAEQDYVDRLLQGLSRDESIYRLMATDIYQNGRYLAAKKYRLLGYAYRVFLAGLVASFVAFLVELG